MRARADLCGLAAAPSLLLATLLATLLAALLALGGCGQGQAPATGPAGLGEAAQKAAALTQSLRARQGRVVALCELALKAAATAPDLARRFCAQALEQAGGLYDPAHQALAERLRALAEQSADPARREEALAAARGLEGQCLRVWPLRLVAEAAAPVAPEVVERALHQALMGLGLNKDQAGRDQDQAGLALVMASRDPERARGLARQVADPGVRSWLWRRMAAQTNQRADLDAAAQAAGEIADPAQAGRCLAAAALARWEMEPQAARALFAAAWERAGLEPDPARRALALGEVAAVLAQADPRQALEDARHAPAEGGARFKALRQVALAYLGNDPARARWALEEADRQVELIPSAPERWQAWALLAKDAAALEPALARAFLANLPPGERTLRGEAEAALILAEVGAGLEPALARARRVDDPALRVTLLLRLADVFGRDDKELAEALRREALEVALARGGDQARQTLAPLVAAASPSKGVDIARGIGENVARARALLAVAKVMAGQGQKAGAQWTLDLALEAVAEADPKHTIDKVRLLGDMGREWAPLESRQSRAFFELGAETAGRMG